MAKPRRQFVFREDQALNKDVNTLFDWISKLEVVDTIPNASRKGQKGDVVIYISGTTYKIYVNVDSNLSWKFASLS